MPRVIDFINKITNEAFSGRSIKIEEAKQLKNVRGEDIYSLFNAAYKIRKKFKGNKVELCAITNARSGGCSEDCAFCAQSSWHKTKIHLYPLLEPKEIYRRAKRAKEIGAGFFCIVTSGRRIKNREDFLKICKVISKIKTNLNIHIDASLGELTLDEAKALKNSGLLRYNHNLETARSLYPKVCTTHTYSDRLKTIENVKKARLELCCGGIFGMGESWSQRLELAFALKELNPECVPINFLNPISGTRLEKRRALVPLELLKIISIFRFIFPKKEIKICGGRETNLRSLQPFLFLAGSDSIIIGDYLTTSGNPPQYDLQMIRDLGLKAS